MTTKQQNELATIVSECLRDLGVNYSNVDIHIHERTREEQKPKIEINFYPKTFTFESN